MPATEHVPDDNGLCRVDGRVWPAQDLQAIHELLRDYVTDPVALLSYLTQHMVTAARREPERDWRDIASQYVAWIPHGALVIRLPHQPRPGPRQPLRQGSVYGTNSRWPR